MESNPANENALRWHVPTGARVPLRFHLTLILCVTVVLSAIAMVVSEEDMRWPTIGMVVLLGGLLAGWKLFSASRQPTGEPNVWLDETGLHWINLAGKQQHMPRETLVSYWIGFDEATQMQVPSLSFFMPDAFLSQPLELHAPASPSVVRAWLAEHWQLVERKELPPAEKLSVDLDILFDEANQLWTFEGTKTELEKMIAAWGDLTVRYALPPLGARPKEYLIACREVDCSVMISPHSWIQDLTLSIPPENLKTLVTEVQTHFAKSEEEFLHSLTCDTGHHWRLLFKVQSPK